MNFQEFRFRCCLIQLPTPFSSVSQRYSCNNSFFVAWGICPCLSTKERPNTECLVGTMLLEGAPEPGFCRGGAVGLDRAIPGAGMVLGDGYGRSALLWISGCSHNEMGLLQHSCKLLLPLGYQREPGADSTGRLKPGALAGSQSPFTPWTVLSPARQ